VRWGKGNRGRGGQEGRGRKWGGILAFRTERQTGETRKHGTREEGGRYERIWRRSSGMRNMGCMVVVVMV
jgi:hypothetical protein